MIALDVETTGTEPHLHSILSLGAVDTENPTNQFYDECRVWEGARIEDEALAINGFSREEVTSTERKTEAELIAAFVAWATDIATDRTLVGQNTSFDRDFVKHACHRAHIDFPFAHRTLDTHTMAYMHMTHQGIPLPLVKHHSAISLDTVLQYCGIPEEPKPHNALTGALCHAEVASRLLYGKALLQEFALYPVPENLVR